MGIVIIFVIVIVEVVTIKLSVEGCGVSVILKGVMLSNIAPACFVWTMSSFGIAEQLYFENYTSSAFCLLINLFFGSIVVVAKVPVQCSIITENNPVRNHLKGVLCSICVLTTFMGALAERICTTIIT